MINDMNNTKLINELKNKGYGVNIYHFRRQSHNGIPWRYYRNKSDWKPLNNGGSTMVYLNKDNKTVSEGIAYCSDSDQFNYKIGVSIALGRAIKRLDA